MNAIATINTPLFTIANTTISIVNGLYSLNDLHKASGNEQKHKPSYFMQNQETKDLVAEINSENSDNGNPPSLINKAFRIVKGGNLDSIKQGTYVCKELVYRYAMWISAKFSLMVIRAFDSMVSRSDSQQREILVKACSRLAIGNMLISEVYTMVGKQFGYEGGIKDIPTPLLPEAVAFVYEMILRLKPVEPNITESDITVQFIEAVMRQNIEMQDIWDGLRYINKKDFGRWSNLIIKTNMLAEKLSNKLSKAPKLDERNKCVTFANGDNVAVKINWFNYPA